MSDYVAPISAADDRAVGGFASSALFLIIFGYFWITLTPLADMGDAAAAGPSADSSNPINQIVVVLVTGAALVAVMFRQSWQFWLNPKILLFMLFAWFVMTSFAGNDPSSSMRRIIFSGLVLICANSFLLLANNTRQFSKLLGWGVFATLALAYVGVLLFPGLAIHQASDAVEAVLAGDWRGHLAHKNIASATMVFSLFIGLYTMSVSSRFWGGAMFVASLIFLLFTGGKTALAMLPAVLVLAYLFEHVPLSRLFVTIGGVVVTNFLLLGSAVNGAISNWISALGVDSSFTGRTDIWRFVFEKIVEAPIFGHGFQAFWQTGSLRYGGGDVETWAVTAAHAHNAYLEMIMNAGIPGLFLVLLLLVVLPFQDASRALKSSNDKNLTRLFLRIWLFCIYLACLESFFFANTGPLWFTMLVAVFGLRLQGRAKLTEMSNSRSRYGEQNVR